jgi:hypothetical protein
MSENNSSIDKLRSLIEKMEKDLRYAKSVLNELEKQGKPDYSQVPGITGTFDGYYLVTETGEKLEVPANYAAKSRLVFGDILKVVEEDGKQLFKQITKVPRKKLEAVANKKEGKWYALAEAGSYKISDIAADFNALQVNDKITILIPMDNQGAPFAALDRSPERVKRVETRTEAVGQDEMSPAHTEQPVRAQETSPKKETLPKDLGNSHNSRSRSSKRDPKDPKPFKGKKERPAAGDSEKEKGSKEFVSEIGGTGGGSFILGDDDLR